MDHAFTVADRLRDSAREKVALVRVEDGRPEVLTILLGGTIGDGEPLAIDPFAYWTVPTSTSAVRGDLLVWRELAWQLTDRCESPHVAWAEYVEWAVARAQELGLDPTMLIGHDEVWEARRLSRSELSHLTDCTPVGVFGRSAVPAEG